MAGRNGADSLRDAVCEALRVGGIELLKDPRGFYAMLTDTAPSGAESEMRVLRGVLSDEGDNVLLSGVIRLSSQSSVTDVEAEERRIKVRLADVHQRQDAVSASCAKGLAEGVAQYLGIDLRAKRKPEPQTKAVPQPAQTAQPSAPKPATAQPVAPRPAPAPQATPKPAPAPAPQPQANQGQLKANTTQQATASGEGAKDGGMSTREVIVGIILLAAWIGLSVPLWGSGFKEHLKVPFGFVLLGKAGAASLVALVTGVAGFPSVSGLFFIIGSMNLGFAAYELLMWLFVTLLGFSRSFGMIMILVVFAVFLAIVHLVDRKRS